MTRLRALISACAALALGGVAFVALPSSAHAAAGLSAAYTKTRDWNGGFAGQYTITNNSTVTVPSWSLSFTLPSTEKVAGVWNGSVTSSGNTYTITGPSWAGPLDPGKSADPIGFNVSYSGTASAPADCRVNGNPCDGGGGGSTPGAPTDVKTVATTTGSVTLSWTAPSTAGAGIAGYHVHEGGKVVATSPITMATINKLSPGSQHSFTVTTYDIDNNESPASDTVAVTVPSSGPPPGASFTAPFTDFGAWPTPNLTQIAQKSGLRGFSLGFIVDGTQPCQATWFNAFPMDKGFGKDDIANVQASGGLVKPSFGGEAGTELAQSCTDVDSLTKQYQSVIDAYHFDYIDFDIEGSAVADKKSVDLRSEAMAKLQAAAKAAGTSLRISLTLPVLPSGLTADGQNVVASAISHGVDVTLVNVMTMDFGNIEAPNPAGKMGEYTIKSAQSTHDQLAKLYDGKLSDSQLWGKVGVTPMLGVNDMDAEIFTQSDMHQVIDFATAHHLGQLSFWDVTRDGNACNGSKSKCTNISQTPFEFAKMIAPYQG